MVETDPHDQPWVPAGTSAYARPKAGPRSGTGTYKTSHAVWLSRELLVWGGWRWSLWKLSQQREVLSLELQDCCSQSVAQITL